MKGLYTKKLVLPGLLVLLLGACTKEDQSNLEPKFSDRNAINIRFRSAADSSAIAVDDAGYTGFILDETGKHFPVLKIQKQWTSIFDSTWTSTTSFMILPVYAGADTSTFILEKQGGGTDTLIIDQYHAHTVFISFEDGYKIEMDEPLLNKVPFSTYLNNGFDSSSNILYLTVYQ